MSPYQELNELNCLLRTVSHEVLTKLNNVFLLFFHVYLIFNVIQSPFVLLLVFD